MALQGKTNMGASSATPHGSTIGCSPVESLQASQSKVRIWRFALKMKQSFPARFMGSCTQSCWKLNFVSSSNRSRDCEDSSKATELDRCVYVNDRIDGMDERTNWWTQNTKNTQVALWLEVVEKHVKRRIVDSKRKVWINNTKVILNNPETRDYLKRLQTIRYCHNWQSK